MKELFRWNGKPTGTLRGLTIAFWVLLFFSLWQFATPAGIPGPGKCWAAWQELVSQYNLIGELFNSAQTCLIAMLLTIVAAMVLAYLSRIPFFEPLVSVPGNFLDEVLCRTKEILNHVEKGIVMDSLK